MYRTSTTVAMSSQSTRNSFIRKTYSHLLLAVLGFAGFEAFLFSSGLAAVIGNFLFSVNWLFVIGGLMIFSWLATRFAQSTSSKPVQYFGLALYVVAQAIIFVPLLLIAQAKAGGGVIESAGLATLTGFIGLTLIAFGTRADFSWMGKFLLWGGVGALVLIVCGSIFGFELGTFFSVGMIIFAGAAILYDTSNIIHHYGEDDYVAASLQLFASVTLMFYYILRFFTSRD